MKFQKKPVIVEATQWFQNGDHPKDEISTFQASNGVMCPTEGKVVRFYRRPDDSGDRICPKCNVLMRNHGWIDTPEGGRIVCPGDWIITAKAEMYPCKPDIFEATYQKVES